MNLARYQFLFLVTQQIDDDGGKAGFIDKWSALFKDRIESLAIGVDSLPWNIRQLFKSSNKGVPVNQGSRAAGQLMHSIEGRRNASTSQGWFQPLYLVFQCINILKPKKVKN